MVGEENFGEGRDLFSQPIDFYGPDIDILFQRFNREVFLNSLRSNEEREYFVNVFSRDDIGLR